MARQLRSFLLRCWQSNGQLTRIHIEHIQTGATSLATSVATAIEWICAQSGDGPAREPDDGERREWAEHTDGH